MVLKGAVASIWLVFRLLSNDTSDSGDSNVNDIQHLSRGFFWNLFFRKKTNNKSLNLEVHDLNVKFRFD